MSFELLAYGVTFSSVVFLCVYAFWWLPRQIQQDFRRGLLAMARTVEMREQDEIGTSALRARYAVLIAQRLKLPKSVIRDIELAAVLQEIGKVAIPYRILNKPSPLTYEEAEVLKLHVVIGQRIILQVPSLARLAPIVRHHHENWDGSGYPDRLRGQEIPLASRILRIVGDFVEMLRHEDLRDPAAKYKVFERMQQGNATLYDPCLLSVLREVLLSEQNDGIQKTDALETHTRE